MKLGKWEEIFLPLLFKEAVLKLGEKELWYSESSSREKQFDVIDDFQRDPYIMEQEIIQAASEVLRENN